MLTFHFSLVNAQSWLWGNSGIGDSWPMSIVSDGQGNSYIAGQFPNDTVHFGSNTLSDSSKVVDAFLVKYSHNGSVLWAKQTVEKCSNPLLAASAPESVCVDRWGNSYLSGNFADTLFIGSNTLITSAVVNYLPQNTYVAKYDPNGNVLWAVNFQHKVD